MKTFALVALLLSMQTFANLHLAPPTLNLERSSKGIFVDFKTASSVITYDIKTRKALATTTIEFSQSVAGKPIFDLVNNPSSLLIDGVSAVSKTTSMNGVSKVRYIDKKLTIGNHTLVIENDITKNLSWSSTYVRSAFWMSDLSDRKYLEQYLPTNLEYDQYKNSFEIKIINSEIEHVLYTNGDLLEISKNHWTVSYPETFTASSLFFHMSKKGLKDEKKEIYKSIDGREIPVTVYTNQSVNRFMSSTLRILAELEKDYGPWPHKQVIVYGAGSGGMEYCGATITSHSALGHELTHSYFARGIMPAHGNSGWVDEAIASWRDGGYRSYSKRSLSKTIMASHSTYQRTTDRNAYSKGMKFIGYLHGKFKEQESFKVFLKSFFETRKFKPFKTHEFKSAVEAFYNTTLTNEFDTYIYGRNGIDKSDIKVKENAFHPHLSSKELFNLL
ncbi:hypothetical protein A9Q84_00730 [Halobacteriovorax marinus]|uniref:Peptidase M1 membrane alanine aminopeptidase domain-containing protein n=1 Tax=Halobacteriovorax marinus TaxID=97084 RepID=A0A1Y5FBU0_9BACT|nr:hypothetical protein A9Q84_00730 [Halobacteriovorax marinus]